jgi:hypothetical protein
MSESRAAGSDRWILAFDAHCSTCSQISAVVKDVSGGRLGVLPLSATEVRQWREAALGRDAPYVPTLLKVGDGAVRGWMGWRLGAVLARRLGPYRTVQVLQALGTLRRQPTGGTGRGLARAQVLRLGAGAVVAISLFAGKGAVAATNRDRAAAQRWVAARGRITAADYQDLTTLSVEQRKQIFAMASPQMRTQLWLHHFASYRASHPQLTARQADLLNRATVLVRRFETESAYSLRADADLLREALLDAYGSIEAHAVAATLGPESTVTDAVTPRATCACCSYDDWCGSTTVCVVSGNCTFANAGCGFAWSYPCDGRCLTS